MTIEDIIAALAGSDRADLANIRLYVEWIKLRRKVNRRFYFEAHWISHPMHELPGPIDAYWI